MPIGENLGVRQAKAKHLRRGKRTMTHQTGGTDGRVPATGPSKDPETPVETIMTRDVVTLDMDDPLHLIQRIFQREGFHHLLVVEEDELVGVISDRDLLSAISPYVNTPSEKRRDELTLYRRAHHIMSRHLITVTPRTPIIQAAALLLQHNLTCLPVVGSAGPVRAHAESHLWLVTTAGRRIEGIVTWRDVLAYYVDLDAD